MSKVDDRVLDELLERLQYITLRIPDWLYNTKLRYCDDCQTMTVQYQVERFGYMFNDQYVDKYWVCLFCGTKWIPDNDIRLEEPENPGESI